MLNLIGLWLGAMGWHLWRCGTMRPAFSKIADTMANLVSFVLVYLAAGILRWAVLAEVEVGFWVLQLQLVSWAITLMLLFERSNRSSSLSMLLLGVSAAVDLGAVGLSFFVEEPPSRLYLVVEFFLYAATVRKFFQLPPELQRPNYKKATVPAVRR